MHGLYSNDASWIDTAGRLLLVAFFVIVWLRNLSKHHVEDHIKRLTVFKCPMPRQAFWAGMILDAVGCVLVLINWHTAAGVLCLIVFTVLATLLLLRFWEMDDPMKRTGMQNGFLANLGVLGGLLLLLQNVM
ncbi:MAG TPA: DoxX family membrane protein [Pseudolabrys sp.]|nr:DoxX family membrane protein [Pseudolabrys sp.]